MTNIAIVLYKKGGSSIANCLYTISECAEIKTKGYGIKNWTHIIGIVYDNSSEHDVKYRGFQYAIGNNI